MNKNISYRNIRVFSVIFLVAFLTVSCGKQSSDYKKLKAQNDSLLKEKERLEREVDDYFSSINQIQENLEKIKSTENVISVEPAGEELSQDARTRINEDINYLNELLQTNKDELARLKSRLSKSSLKLTELERTITRLTKTLEEETARIAFLEKKLAEKDTLIAQMGSTISQMGENINTLTTENKSKEEKIKQLDENLHSAWYVFGSRKELIDQKILTSKGIFRKAEVLKDTFNKDYFVRIDARNAKTIPLYASKAKILTTHPTSSYTIEKQDGKLVLIIVDPTAFWSVSKYLVIEVD
jgi:chromosome segregation ATPase